MKAPVGYDTVEAKTGGFQPITPGGYVLRLTECIERASSSNNEMLELHFDIAEGEFSGYFTRQVKDGKWPIGGKYYQLVEGETHVAYYKGMLKAFYDSNPGKFPKDAFTGPNHQPKRLISLIVGGCIGEEEYEKADGTIGTGTKIKFLCGADRVRSGEIKAPAKKVISTSAYNQSAPPPTDLDLPF